MSNSNFNRLAEFPRNHVTITPSDANNLSRPMLIMAGTAGDIVIVDENGTSITYTVTAGSILPVIAVKVPSTNTTVTQVIGLY